jgi:hypothetical protein
MGIVQKIKKALKSSPKPSSKPAGKPKTAAKPAKKAASTGSTQLAKKAKAVPSAKAGAKAASHAKLQVKAQANVKSAKDLKKKQAGKPDTKSNKTLKASLKSPAVSGKDAAAQKASHKESLKAAAAAEKALEKTQKAAQKAAQAAADKQLKAEQKAALKAEQKALKDEQNAKESKASQDEANEGPAVEEEIHLTDAEGRRFCRTKECDQIAVVDGGYCRYHYLLFWRNIQNRKKILTEGKLERYIEELTARYPDKYLEMLRKDLRTEKEFMSAIAELEIDEAAVDNEYEDEAQSFLEEVRGVGGGEAGAERDDDF